MNNRERFKACLKGDKNIDRVPMVEWATWWNLTTDNWKQEGLPEGLNTHEIMRYFGLDDIRQIWINPRSRSCPAPAYHGAGLLNNEKEYRELKKYLFSKEIIEQACDMGKQLRVLQDRGEITFWITLEGFFWFPRTLFGIENHLFAFYDYPELMHEMNKDLIAFQLEVIEKLFEIIKPDFMTFAEDMSYNNGPMLSKEAFDEFLSPYYKQVIPCLKESEVCVFVDTDGDVTKLIPWLMEVGVEGLLPLEKQAGVDIVRIRNQYPELKLIGGFDKTIMHLGEEAMRREFERILPVIKTRYYIPGVDHQTPPDVSLENYHTYVKLLKEYCGK
ncbi:MAG: uroporphyrinogen decarboxylase family protein [Cellulosilyticaceae bacterium]